MSPQPLCLPRDSLSVPMETAGHTPCLPEEKALEVDGLPVSQWPGLGRLSLRTDRAGLRVRLGSSGNSWVLELAAVSHPAVPVPGKLLHPSKL